MSRYLYLLAILCSATLFQAGTASASSFTAMTDWTSARITDSTNGTTESFEDDKIVQEAHDDAARFVASNGEQRGVRLEAALAHIRTKAPHLAEASDLQLAQAIMTL
ncbi:DUF2388 domain-containing protein [Azomonas macrocytogenes]|uniref:Uncharacterized protein (TIGR02448 family) n=1 Tax=Azomonas macrocytogenes TaxID=69962 RepID=A0A839T0Z9_AZOMA|nr:DUF2388 domain-containing protein [Azomonas macrocytogenes]MBB3103247.1 uncharacterized protein (TIGR02448 family) [Azomonas macrocytogenes]